MYITDADGKIVQFSYQNDDDEEEFMYQSKSKMQVAKEQNTFGGSFGGSPQGKQNNNSSIMVKGATKADQVVDFEDDIENDKELKQLSLYKKIVVANSPKGKGKTLALEEAKLSAMPQVLGDMVNQIKPSYERRQIASVLEELKKHKSLQTLLFGVKAEQLTNEEIVLLIIWTSPLVTPVQSNDEYSIYARGILGVDVLEAQGLLRNCKTNENHLINIVESYFEYMRQMPEQQFLQVLRNAVYSMDKAYDLQKILVTLGENWFNLREQIKNLKLEEAPKIENPKLAKGITVNQIGGKNAANLKDYQEVDILIKLIPYFDIPLSKSSKIVPEATNLRKMINLAKSEAEMILRRKKLNTLLDVVKGYFELLLMPENTEKVELDFLDCFFQSKQRSKLFVQTLARIVWEYNFINKMFIEVYKKLSNLSSTNPAMNIPKSREVMIFGGPYPLSSGQISAIMNIVMEFPTIKGLSFNFTRVKNQGLQVISKILNSKKWKTIRPNDELLYSLDLTNNFIDQDGIKSLIDVFFDQFDIKSSVINEAPLPTSIRILILDHNFLGKGGADVIGTILSSSRQLKILSMNRTRLIGNDLKKLCQSLSVNPYLKVLNLGQNKLSDTGVQFIANALKVNIGLTHLDLFDVEFGDDGALQLAEALLLNKTLINLRLANTKVKPSGSTPLLNSIIGNTFLKVFRWVNLLPLPASEDMGPKDATRIFILESRNNAMSRAEYLNPYMGDISYDLLYDLYKVPFFTRQKDVNFNRELDAVLSSYCDYLVDNWTNLEKGSYNELRQRPEITFRQVLTEDMVRDNMPELSLEEKVLVQMTTMDIPKDKSGQYLAESGKQPGEFKMLEAEKKNTDRKVTGTKSPVRGGKDQKAPVATNSTKLQTSMTQLDSVANFAMTDFAPGSPYTRNIAREVMVTLVHYGIDFNYLNKQGYSPLMESIKNKLKSLQTFLLSGYAKTIDVNQRSQALGKKLATAMHIAVESNDYDSLKLLLEYTGEPRREVGLKDANGKNPMDLAFDLDFTSMKELLYKHGGHQSSQALQEQYQILQIMKPIQTKKNESETITIFNLIVANSMDRFQKLLLMGQDINQRDNQNQVPLHYAATHSREPMLMMLVKQGAFIDAKDINGMTPLHMAAMKKDPTTLQANLQIIERLVTFGANIDSVAKDGSTPLHLACQNGAASNVILLLKLGAQMGIFNMAKQTPDDVTTSQEIKDILNRVRAERRSKNQGGDEFVSDI